MITREEMDRAAEVIWTGRKNVRSVKCAVWGCRAPCPPNHARRLWVDGHLRGFVCARCRKGLRWKVDGRVWTPPRVP